MRILTAISTRPWALGVLGVATVALIGFGGYFSYRTYDFIEHDNDFCMSCHLMAEPMELFAESAHRGLGCKACHQPSMVERTSMALTQVVDNPDTLGVHAEVPDERCVTCHVEGDPEKWRSIASSAGHRVHLESADTTLADLKCVGCHSASLHEFSAVDLTCTQSGCHENNTLNLGAMSDLTVHCAACHSFSAPVDEGLGAEAASLALSPTGGDCLSCHTMREKVQMPEDDPHESLCASCHNPHDQEAVAEAVETCAIGGCHDDAAEVTDFHVGLHDDDLDDCSACHVAHDFKADGNDCAACHEEIFDDPGSAFDPPDRARATSPQKGTHVGVWPLIGGVGVGIGARSDAARSDRARGPAYQSAVADSLIFRHGEHREVECLSCHSTEGTHGRVTVATVNDCRSCHHTEPVKTECAACHEGAPFAPGAGSRTHEMAFEVGAPVRRDLPFDHDVHEAEACATCHTDEGGPALSAFSVSCSSCHEEHHEPEMTCRSCHLEAPIEEHPIEEVHVGCSGGGCHAESPFDAVPSTREFCLSCHQDLVDHKIEDDRDCAVCHTLPEPRRLVAGGP
jgi:nitrate/TMAO reductase-like tetraheme cytochrome c subunit